MSLLDDAERPLAEAVAGLATANPFLPERIDHERRALGDAYVDLGPVWHRREATAANPNVARVAERLAPLVRTLRLRLARGERRPRSGELALYEQLVLYHLYCRFEDRLHGLFAAPADDDEAAGDATSRRAAFYADYEAEALHFFDLPGAAGGRLPAPAAIPHLFACSYQIRRAFHHAFHQILGGSMPAARLRAAVWQSIFSHDMERYRRALWARMGEITTLVTGPSGTGKELVARAIGLSRYQPFDAARRRFADAGATFQALNLSALSPTLVESELFGHRRGAFTGAVGDRVGWLEACGADGTVFLDEIGDVDRAIQVKLLRVLESRTFERLGDTATRRFAGKVIAATHRDLAREIAAGRFREDLYYRLCSDLVETPALRDQLAGDGEELRHLVVLLARRLAGPDEAEGLADEVVDWIDRRLGRDYPWPGNVRELEQCVRNVLIRREYHPPRRPTADATNLAAAVARRELDADELLGRYVTHVYHETGSYLAAARRLGLDRRTVKARVDEALLRRLREA